MSDTQTQILAGLYRVGPEIGRGSFASVYKGQNINTKIPVAVKSIQIARLNKKLLENIDHEISILKRLKHPHIVSLLDNYKTSSHFYLIMEYCSLGDLSFFFRKRKEISDSLPLVNSLFQRYPPTPDNGLHEDVARHFLKQLASALEFLRLHQLIHRDIKPQNLLLCPPQKSLALAKQAGVKGLWELPILKLADFGFARILPSTSMAETLCGSPLYMAPEILRLEKYTAKADLWSVGAVLYEMVSGKPPFRAANHVQLLALIEKSDNIIQFPESSNISSDIKRLIRGLLKKDPTERMGFAEFFNDPVIVNVIHPPSKPLDQSFLDQFLYISEYIQLGPTNPRNLSDVPKSHSPPNQKQKVAPSDISNLPRQPAKKKIQTHGHSKQPKPKAQPSWDSDPSKPDKNTNPVTIKNTSLDTASTTSSWVTSQHLPSQPTNQNPSPSEPVNSPTTNKASSSNENKSLQSNHDPFSRPFDSESEYVVVEKRTVEVNSFADELVNPANEKNTSTPNSQRLPVSDDPSTQQQQKEYYQNQYYQYTQKQNLRRSPSTKSSAPIPSPTSTGVAVPVATGATNNRLVSNTGSNRYRNNSASSGSPSSLGTPPIDATARARPERRNSIIYGSSPSNALSRALHMATARIFGKSNNENVEGYLTSNLPLQHQRHLSISSTPSADLDEKRLFKRLENMQSKSKVLILFAEVKYQQMIPFDDSSQDNIDLDNDTMTLVAYEAFALYYKSLALLDKFMKIASQWWNSRREMGVIINTSPDANTGTQPANVPSSLQSDGTSFASPNVVASDRLVELVQWARERFNECLSRADYAQAQISKYSDKFTNLDTRGMAERLIFDRALEMSKSAARLEKAEYPSISSTPPTATPTVSSTNNDNNALRNSPRDAVNLQSTLARNIADLEECVVSYSTAVWMFESLLENNEADDASNKNNAMGKYSDVSIALDLADRERVIKAIDSVSQRLGTVRKKVVMLVNQQAQLRLSNPSPTNPNQMDQLEVREGADVPED